MRVDFGHYENTGIPDVFNEDNLDELVNLLMTGIEKTN